MVEENEKNLEVSWSMDLETNQKISRALDSAGSYEEKGELAKTIRALRRCRFSFNNSLSDEERKELDSQEADLKIGVWAFNLNKTKDDDTIFWEKSVEVTEKQREIYRKIIKIGLPNFEKRVKKYFESIVDLLDQYGYLSKKKKDKSELNF